MTPADNAIHTAPPADTCSRCRREFQPGDRVVADPCCGAPDCDGLTDRSHFRCLPPALQRMEQEG